MRESVPQWGMLQLAQASGLAPGLGHSWQAVGQPGGQTSSVCGGFQPPSEQAGRRSRGSFFGFVPEGTPQRSQRNLLGGVEAG
jgi:hypothetical protein